MVEVYRGHPERDRHTAKHFVYSLDAVDEGSSGDDPALRVQQELGRIALAFDDLERVVRPYERLLPALQTEDPLTEAIAGIAAETRDMAAVADMPRLLDELRRALERLRTQVARPTR